MDRAEQLSLRLTQARWTMRRWRCFTTFTPEFGGRKKSTLTILYCRDHQAKLAKIRRMCKQRERSVASRSIGAENKEEEEDEKEEEGWWWW